MAETSGKGSGKIKNEKLASDKEKLVQLTQVQLESLIKTMISNATAQMGSKIDTLEAEVTTLKKEVKEMQKTQQFISDKHDDLSEDYNKVLSDNKQCKQELHKLMKCATKLHKKI